MRINKYVAQASGLSRRGADKIIEAGHIEINGKPSTPGDIVNIDDQVTMDGRPLNLPNTLTIILNKPPGYVCSRKGQGHPTIYELLPNEYKQLKTVGRLDKDSSGLLVLTNDGDLANKLTHPRYSKEKLYIVELDKPLSNVDYESIIGPGITLEDGVSRLKLNKLNNTKWKIIMSEGRNRQIRRTFAALGYKVRTLNRLQVGPYSLDALGVGQYRTL